MRVYMIALAKPNEEVWSIVKKKWPDRQHYILNDRLAFVTTPPSGRVVLTEDLCEELGMEESKKIVGLVSEVPDTINGWQDDTFWEWLEKVSS